MKTVTGWECFEIQNRCNSYEALRQVSPFNKNFYFWNAFSDIVQYYCYLDNYNIQFFEQCCKNVNIKSEKHIFEHEKENFTQTIDNLLKQIEFKDTREIPRFYIIFLDTLFLIYFHLNLLIPKKKSEYITMLFSELEYFEFFLK